MKYEFKELKQTQIQDINSNIELLKNIDTVIEFKIGERKIKIKEVLDLKPGSLIPLNNDNLEIDVLMGGKKFATGEVMASGDEKYIKIKEIIKK